MNITLYKNLSDDKVINKTKTEARQLTGTLYEPTDVLNPKIDITMFNGVFEYNYLYIPVFGRYYFITDITVVDGRKIQLTCHVDALESWWNKGLSNVECHITRQQDWQKANFYLVDNRLVTTGRHLTYVKTAEPSIQIALPGDTSAFSYIFNTM